MREWIQIKKWIALLLLCFLLTIAPLAPAFAQDDEEEATGEAPTAEVQTEPVAEETEVVVIVAESPIEDGETEEEEENAPPGIELGIVLIGLAAIIFVGIGNIGRYNKQDQAS